MERIENIEQQAKHILVNSTKQRLNELPLKLPTIAVVIPAYRAAALIQTVLSGIPNFIAHVIVVNDCSPDETAALVEAWPDPRVRLMSHTENQGVGGAILSGYEAALELGAEIIVKMDSDDQMDPAYLLPLITPIVAGEADYAKGNRFLHARQLQMMPLRRRIGNLGLSFLTKLASGYWQIFDPTNGYTAIHASIIPLLDRDAIGKRYFFESSMFLELGLLRAVIKDVYIPARYGNEISSLSEFKTMTEFPFRLFKGFVRRLWIQYFLRDFGICSIFLISGIILFLFGLIFGSYHWIYAALANTPTPTGTIMLAVLPIILGIQFLLQAIVIDVQNVPVQPLQCQNRLILL